MKINGIIISERKMKELSAVLSADQLYHDYVIAGLSGPEISEKCNLSESWVCKLRKIYGIETRIDYGKTKNPLRFVPLTQYQKEFLHGSLFGDSCITLQKSGTGYWLCRHSTKQELYLLKIAQIMNPFTAKIWYGTRPFKKGGVSFPYISTRSYALPQFTEYRRMFYPFGVKTITLELMEKLTPTGFAFWYLDDGSCSGYGFVLTTFDPFFRDIDRAKELFDSVLGLKVSIHWRENGEGTIRVLKETHDRAWEYIESEITNDLCHKIPYRYRSMDNQQPSLDGNVSEGSTTGESLNPVNGYGDNSHLEEEIFQDMPGICDEQMVIQSELIGNYER